MKFHKLLIYSFLWVFLSKCTINIDTIIKKPAKFEGKKVHIYGEVINSIQFPNLKIFTVKDRTGKINVVTKNLLPLKRDKIRVKGTVHQGFQYQGRSILIIKEKRKKIRRQKSWKKIKSKL